MGTARFWTIIVVAIINSTNAMANDMNNNTYYESDKHLFAWAENFFLGGFEIHKIERGAEERLLIVIGIPSSGLPTSEIYVFKVLEGEKYQQMIHHGTVLGVAKVEEDEDGVSILINETHLLSFSWSNLKIFMGEKR